MRLSSLFLLPFVSSASRTMLFAAPAVRNCKPPQVYKGKGIMYIDEVIKKKQGKKSK